MSDEILVDVRNHIAFVTLNRPQTLNTLTYGMIKGLAQVLEAWQKDDQVNAIVIRGAGEKAFCAGGDVRAIHDGFKSGNFDLVTFFADEYRLDHFIHRYAKPIVALMDGIVMGGGMGIAQGAQFRIATDRTRMAMPETAIGLFPDVGASYFLSRLEGAMGIYLGLVGQHIRASDILRVGLADVYLDTHAVVALEQRLADISWTDDRERDIKMALNTLASEAPGAASIETIVDVIDDHFSHDTVAEMIASLLRETRAPYKDWAAQTLATLAKRSPTAMCVTLEQLRRGRKMSLANCFRMELDMIHEAFYQGDFMEGVRALLVDKDQNPRWNPTELSAVTQASVERFFDSPWDDQEHPLADLKP